MSDTPHIKRFDDYFRYPTEGEIRNGLLDQRGWGQNPWISATVTMLNDLAEHVERLEHRIELLERFRFQLPPGVSIDHLGTDTPKDNA